MSVRASRPAGHAGRPAHAGSPAGGGGQPAPEGFGGWPAPDAAGGRPALDAVGGRAAPDAAGEWRAPFVLDLPQTLGVHQRGRGDPAFRITGDGAIWRTALTPAGPGTLRVAAAQLTTVPAVPGPATLVRAASWGPGASWLLGTLPALLGSGDDRAGFDPAHPVLREMSARYQGVRVGRSGLVFEALVPAVLGQKVVGVEARRAWRFLLLRFGAPAPGPAPPGMRVFPPPRVWRRIPSWDWHRAGVEGVRARTIIGAAEVAGRLDEIVTMAPAAADRRLRSLPGIGPWTSAETRQRACGDADAVSVGDYHLPAAVGWALAGRVVDDAGMLELLAPYAGHRHRAARLVELGGLGPPRRGPRMSVRDYRAF
ncbi:MAG TPA: DNA-3-methyladenine glycosylase 2 family protein [Streptosporangiaceae bacterium]|nr:DNA-3-methyladenine glycosylase 2 family protein [Streptosporangiaceae bacterium]